MIMPASLMVGVLMPMITPFSMYMSMIVTAALSMNMLVIMIMPTSFVMMMTMVVSTSSMVDMVVTFFCMLTVFLHVTVPRAAAMPAPLLHLLLLSKHLINYSLLRLCGHLVSSDELHGLLGYKSVHLLPLLLHQLLDVDALIAEPSEVICDQVQVVAPFAPYQHYADLIGILGEGASLSVLTHIAGEHNHQKALAVSHHTLQVRLLEGVRQVLTLLRCLAAAALVNLVTRENVDSNLVPTSGRFVLGRKSPREVKAAPHEIVLLHQGEQ